MSFMRYQEGGHSRLSGLTQTITIGEFQGRPAIGLAWNQSSHFTANPPRQ